VKATSINPIVGALRFFYGITLGQKEIVELIPFTRKEDTLPAVLTQDEVVRLLKGEASLVFGVECVSRGILNVSRAAEKNPPSMMMPMPDLMSQGETAPCWSCIRSICSKRPWNSRSKYGASSAPTRNEMIVPALSKTAWRMSGASWCRYTLAQSRPIAAFGQPDAFGTSRPSTPLTCASGS